MEYLKKDVNDKEKLQFEYDKQYAFYNRDCSSSDDWCINNAIKKAMRNSGIDDILEHKKIVCTEVLDIVAKNKIKTIDDYFYSHCQGDICELIEESIKKNGGRGYKPFYK